MRLHSLLALVCLVSTCLLYGQNSGSIKGVLKDSTGKQVLSLATVTVFVAKDTSIVTYRLSDPTGTFRIPGLPIDVPCRVLVSYSGFRTFRKDFRLTKDSSALDLGVIRMQNESGSLEEVVVFAERPPVTVRKDTIEFNAAAFKTLPTALLEDLLKKLPGLEIDPEGNIMVKGKRVNRLLVDGKEFFGGDPLIATKNLPANIVDKVQVMNDKEEMDKNPLTPESEIGQVVNIKLKRSIKQGWFGKAYAGGGTDSRHEAGAILNAFRDTTQISVLGYTNNINRAGFGISDVQRIGGFQRSGYNSMSIYSDGGFAINDISFGGTGHGLQRSTGGGFNFNNQYGRKVTMNLQYFYGQINSEFENKTNQQRFFRDTVLTTLSSSAPQTVSMNHRLGGMVKWAIDSFTNLTFRPGITMSTNRNENVGTTQTSENYRGKINDSRVATNGKGGNQNAGFNLYVVRTFRKKGRSLNFTTDFTNVSNDVKNFTNGVYTTFRNGSPEDSVVNQLRRTIGENLSSSTYIYFTEPLTSKLSLQVNNSTSYIKQSNVIDFLDRNNLSGKYENYIDQFSNSISRNGWKNTTTTSLNYRYKQLTIRAGLNFLAADFNNRFTRNPAVDQRFQFLYPSVSVTSGPLTVSYSASVQEPDATNLQEVIDVSNRFYQQFGNPNLKPTYTHNLSSYFNKFYPKSGNSISGGLNGGVTNNAIMREVTIDRDGIQTTRPVNVDGTYRVNGNVSYGYQYKFNKNFRFNTRLMLFSGLSRSIISINSLRSGQMNYNLGPQVTFGINYKDKIELNQRYTENYRKTNYDKGSTYRDIFVRTQYAESELIIRMPKHFVWENLINYTYNPQVAAGIRKTNVRWNAGLNYLFLKDEQGQLKFSVFDLLNQNISVYRNVSENYVTDTENSTLKRYFMLTFTYNLRNFAGGKVGGRDRGGFLF